jgi:protein phosphatase
LRYSATSDPGSRGGENEDSIGFDPDRRLWFVADGMGGHGHGAVASQLVRSTMLGQAGSIDLPQAIRAAHESIVAAGEQDATLQNMGSTIVAARIASRRCQVAWVGDSRAYLFREGTLRALTRDHSYVELLRELGELSEEQLQNHPKGHVITRGLGMADAEASLIEEPLRTGDWIVLCSDGLTEELTDSQIAAALASLDSVNDAAATLVARALARGGHDNVSAIVIEYDGPHWRPWLDYLRPGLLWSVGTGMAAALLVAALWWWFT